MDRPEAEPAVIDLTQQVVVVTGASAGLGAEFVKALDRAGASLILTARRADRLEALAAECREAICVPADLTDPETAATVTAAAKDHFGRIDGLINNAGVTNVTPALLEDIEDFRRVIDINLVAPFEMARGTARVMRDGGGGSIVNIGSIVGQQALTPLPEAGYAASKGGITALTRELATQWARYGIRVNAIAPGGFSTEMTGDVWEPDGIFGDYIHDRVPLRRSGRPGELDTILLTLLHPSTSYLTGQVIAVDGGMGAC
jgi:NAD(P)-dependent dehydrogenase (short-subunit alcohol dehydrogenase family)